jgi:hypothetical protein
MGHAELDGKGSCRSRCGSRVKAGVLLTDPTAAGHEQKNREDRKLSDWEWASRMGNSYGLEWLANVSSLLHRFVRRTRIEKHEERECMFVALHADQG